MKLRLAFYLLVFVVWGLALPVCAAESRIEITVAGRVVLGSLRTPATMSRAVPIVVMTHGTLAHKDMETIKGMAAALAERGIATLTHTLSLGQDRRAGMYDCPTPHDYLTDDAIDEIAAWVAEASKQSDTVYVLGHSRGANQVARYLAATPRAGVAGAILVAPATGTMEAKGRASYAATYGAPLEPLLARAEGLVREGRGGEWMSVPGFIYCKDARVTARAFASFYGYDGRQDTAALVAKLKLPILVIAATKDVTVTDVIPSFEPVAAAAKDRVRIETIEDADHFFLDLSAEDAADRIAGFVKPK